MNKETLDEIAKNYHTSSPPDMFIENAGQRHSLKWINEQIQDCKSVLELGYGDGIVTENLINQNKDLTQIEGSKILVDKVKEKYGDKIKCEHSLFEEFAPTEQFDAIIASHVLEHVDDPVVLLKRMHAWLKPEGKLVILVPNKESIHRRLAVLMKLQPELDTLSKRDYLVGHQRVYSLYTLKEDVKEAGFISLNARGFAFKPLPNSMMIDFDQKLIEAMNTISDIMPPQMMANLGLVATKPVNN